MDSIPHHLFVRDCCGTPCRFALDTEPPNLLQEVEEWIKAGGGKVEDHRKSDCCDCRIHLVDPKSRLLPNKDDGDVFSINYIKDCVEAKKLLENLVDYRVNPRSIFENYDPMKMLMGQQKWCELSRKLSAKIRSPTKTLILEEDSDIDDEVTLKAPVPMFSNVEDIRKNTLKAASTSTGSSTSLRKVTPSDAIIAAVKERNKEKQTVKKVSASGWLSKTKSNHRQARKEPVLDSTIDSATTAGSIARAPYTQKEEESIVIDIVKNHAYNRLKGNEYWKEVENHGRACKGYRSWQSMKERFRRKILPIIYISFDNVLTLHDLENFDKHKNGIQVDDPSDEDSSDNEYIEKEPASNTEASEDEVKEDLASQDLLEEVHAKLTPITVLDVLEINEKYVENDEIRSNGSTYIVDENESPEKNEISTPIRKKKRTLWSQNQNKRVSMLTDELLATTSKAMKRAREDYLNDPVPSVSKENPPFKVPKEKLSTIIETSDFEDDNMSTISTASSSKNLYTRSEEINIIQWIIGNNRHSEIKGIKLWRELEKSNQVPGRTSQSMKERFRKHILPKIQHYQLKKEQVVLFNAYK